MLHYSILMCLALLQLNLLLSLQRCPNLPICASGSLDQEICRCTVTTRPQRSICPPPFTLRFALFGSPTKTCYCQSTTKPRCPGGTLLNEDCMCSLELSPSCPSGTTISDSDTVCNRTEAPVCPCEADLNTKECICDERAKPVCPPDMVLSRNGCACSLLVLLPPQCEDGLNLEMKRCCCSKCSKKFSL